ncbi:protein NRT1/ PTR FAMILY 7.3-like [Fagus crenata]
MMCNFQGAVDGKVKREQDVCTLDGTIDRHGRPAVRERSGSWVEADGWLNHEAEDALFRHTRSRLQTDNPTWTSPRPRSFPVTSPSRW